jgi:hypothetical protein
VGFCALAASLGLVFVSLRGAAAAGAVTACVGQLVYAWKVAARPVERVWFGLGAAGLAAGGVALLYGPWSSAVPAGLLAGGVLGWAAGLVMASRQAPAEALADAVRAVVGLPTGYLLVAGVWAVIVGSRAAGQLALVVGIGLATLAVAWANSSGLRWYRRVVVVVASLVGVFSVVALFFAQYRWAGVAVLRFVALAAVVLAVFVLVRARPWRWPGVIRARRAAADAEAARQVAAAAPRPWSPSDVALRDHVADAVRLAARERATDEPLTTGQVLAALVRMDIHADWQRIWLHTGDPTARLIDTPDPPARGGPVDWHGIPFSGRLAWSFALLQRLTHSYPNLHPAGSGTTMLALVADPGNGASTTLLCHGTISHGQLLHMIQTDIIRLNLPGVSALILDALDRQ